MCQSCEIHIDGVWLHIDTGQQFNTPDNLRQQPFRIVQKEQDAMHISRHNTCIKREAFEEELHYLRRHRHYSDHPCEIRSSNDPASAGPLCIASRNANNNVRENKGHP